MLDIGSTMWIYFALYNSVQSYESHRTKEKKWLK